MTWGAAIKAVAEALNGIFSFIGQMIGLAKEQDQKRNEAQALERRDEKHGRIDDFVTNANRVPPDGNGDTHKAK